MNMHVHNIWTFLHAERAFPLRKVRWFWYRLNCYWSTHEFYWALNDASVNGEDNYIRSWCCLKLKRFNTIVQYLFIVMSFFTCRCIWQCGFETCVNISYMILCEVLYIIVSCLGFMIIENGACGWNWRLLYIC